MAKPRITNKTRPMVVEALIHYHMLLMERAAASSHPSVQRYWTEKAEIAIEFAEGLNPDTDEENENA
jgi:hypothetical protein